MSADARARILAECGAEPEWLGSEVPKLGFVPYCNEGCRKFDGKRCELLGRRPGTICEPAVQKMSEALDKIEDILR